MYVYWAKRTKDGIVGYCVVNNIIPDDFDMNVEKECMMVKFQFGDCLTMTVFCCCLCNDIYA